MGNGLIRQATKRDIFIVDKLGTSSDVIFKLRRRKLEKGLMPMIEFISDNWKLLSVIFGAMAYLYKQIMATRRGIRALLRADLIRLYNKYHDDLKYCPLYVKQALEDEYESYHVLKGNGVGTQMYEALMALPTEPPNKMEG